MLVSWNVTDASRHSTSFSVTLPLTEVTIAERSQTAFGLPMSVNPPRLFLICMSVMLARVERGPVPIDEGEAGEPVDVEGGDLDLAGRILRCEDVARLVPPVKAALNTGRNADVRS